MSILSGTLGAVLSSDAQGDATKQNAQNVANTNAQNLLQFHQSRGQGGNAVLPEYMTGPGGSFEAGTLAPNLMDAWGKTYASASKSLPQYQGIVDKYAPMADAARTAAGGIFNGGLRNQLQQNLAPVAEARVSYSRQTAADALSKTLAQIEATQAQKGFAGDSSANQMLRFQANKTAGDTVAGANLQNLGESRAINDQAAMLPLQNLSLPSTMAQQEISTAQMPIKSFNDQIASGLQPQTFLRLGVGQPYQYQPMPQVQPIASLGQNLAQGAAGAGNMVAQYYSGRQQQQDTLDAIKAMYGPRTGNVTGYAPTTWNGAASSYNADAAQAALSGVGSYGYGGTAYGLGADTGAAISTADSLPAFMGSGG